MRNVSFVLAVGFAGALAAFGATERREAVPLDELIRHREGGAISVVPREVHTLAPKWQSWALHVDERTAMPSLLSGPGVAWLSEAAAAAATVDDLDPLARAFLAANVDLFGSWSDLLELDRDASLPLREGHWQLVYRQRVNGVRVENARLDLHVVRGRMVMAGAENWSRPVRSGIPKLKAQAAVDRLDAYLGAGEWDLVTVGEPQLVMIAVETGHELVWRVLLDENGSSRRWVGEIDAHDGAIDAFYEGTQYGAVRGGVFPISSSGDCTDGGCEVPGMPMPYADATESGQSEQFGDAYGNLVCVDPAATAVTNLIGPYVRIVDSCGPASESGTCGGGLDLGMKAGENCAVAPGESAGNTSAARTSYYHINRVAQVARFYQPANAWLNAPLTVNVNVASWCNANWTGSVINMYGAGGNCNNIGENAGILVHEWGHGYDQNDGGGIDKPSEAYADIVNVIVTRASCQGNGTLNDGSFCNGEGDPCLSCTGFREFDWTQRQSGTPATPLNWAIARCPNDFSSFAGPCRKEPHCESYVSSEAIYDLAARDLPAMGMDQDSAWQLVDRLWFSTRPGSGGNAYTCTTAGASNSCLATSWYQKMRVADDDDGNLANGTPHAAALFAAFNRHVIACGLASDATNQNHTSCPALAAPVVTRTSSPAGVELSWAPVAGAAAYHVYRGELGCDRQQVPIAKRTAAQTSYLDDSADSDVLRSYRVQAFGATPACASPVSACVAAPSGSRLTKTAHRVVDDGDGIPEPGETIDLAASLRNGGGDPATGTTAHLTPIGPAHVRIIAPEASWPSIPSTGTAESAAPQPQLVILPQAECGQVLTVDLDGAASNSPPFSSRISIPMGATTRDYTRTDIVPIPFLTTTPVQTTFTVTDDRTIADLDLTIDIFHQTPTQIVVELTSPQGTTVRLHDRGPGIGHGIETRFDRDTPASGPGSMADFAGESLFGTWTLSVSDLDASGETTDGYIRPRSLNATIVGGFGCEPQTCAEPTPTMAPVLGVARSLNDLVLEWTAVSGAGYHVLQSPDPRFLQGVEVIGNPATATPLTLQNGVTTTPAVTFFQARAVNACHFEGP